MPFFIVSTTLFDNNKSNPFLPNPKFWSFGYPTRSNTELIPFRNEECPKSFSTCSQDRKTGTHTQTVKHRRLLLNETFETWLNWLFYQLKPSCGSSMSLDVQMWWGVEGTVKDLPLSVQTQTALPSPHTWRRRDSRDRQTTVSIPVKSGIWYSICVSAAADRSWRTRRTRKQDYTQRINHGSKTLGRPS